jgi:hypothetical protein
MDSRDRGWKEWTVFILVTIAAIIFVLLVVKGEENKAQACVAHGGRWIEYAKDYYTCAEAK